MKSFTAVLLVAAISLCSADISLKLKEDDFSTTDNQGGYRFGFNNGHLARQEERTPEGVVRGAYRYIDANGEVQTISYTADKYNGFVASGSNIPKIGRIPEPVPSGDIIEVAPAGIVAVDDTPAVKAARAEHLEAHKRALRELPQFNIEQLPVQVQYTAEVAAARVQHINALNQERLRSLRNYPTIFSSLPSVQYVIPSAQYHPDYLPYAAL